MTLKAIVFQAAVFFIISVPTVLLGAEWYVDASVSSSGDGKTWETAFRTIQDGIDAASPGDTAIVAEETYVENIQFKGKNIVLKSTEPLNPAVVAATIIDGNQTGSVVTFAGTEDETCVLSGFTVRNGSGEDGGGILGGRWDVGTHAIVENNTITGNSANYGGGLSGCHGKIQNNTIMGNSATGNGGGVSSCGGTIQNNTIMGNSATGNGGGLYRCGGTIQNNTITENSANYGGGLSSCGGTIQNNAITGNLDALLGGGLSDCHGTIQNNTITDNSGLGGGGLWWCDGTIQNNTIAGNSALWGGGGGVSSCGGTIRNCIMWGNTGAKDAQLCESSIPSFSCIEGWSGGGEGNIAEDPRFVDAENSDFRIRPDSACIDAGLNSPDLPEFDMAGMHRIMFGGKSLTADIGAYEFYINTLTPGPGPQATTFTWSSLADKTYSIFYTDDLLNWHTAIASFPSSGSTTTFWTDDGSLTGLPPLLAPKRFYRVLENP